MVSGMAPILASRCGRMAPGTVPPTVCPALLPVVTNYRNILFDILVHGQDIALPLGLRRDMPVEAARAGATRVWTMGWPFWANRRLRGFRLTATDTTWTSGKGADIRGPIDADAAPAHRPPRRTTPPRRGRRTGIDRSPVHVPP